MFENFKKKWAEAKREMEKIDEETAQKIAEDNKRLDAKQEETNKRLDAKQEETNKRLDAEIVARNEKLAERLAEIDRNGEIEKKELKDFFDKW